MRGAASAFLGEAREGGADERAASRMRTAVACLMVVSSLTAIPVVYSSIAMVRI